MFLGIRKFEFHQNFEGCSVGFLMATQRFIIVECIFAIKIPSYLFENSFSCVWAFQDVKCLLNIVMLLSSLWNVSLYWLLHSYETETCLVYIYHRFSVSFALLVSVNFNGFCDAFDDVQTTAIRFTFSVDNDVIVHECSFYVFD